MSQPAPQGGHQPVAPLVFERLEGLLTRAGQVPTWEWLSERLLARVQAGYEKYGTVLMTKNGRDPLMDAWEEAADLVMYLTQANEEGEAGHFQLMQAENLLCSLSQLLQMREGRE